MLWQDKYLARVKVYLCWVPIREKHERDVSPWPTEGCLTPQPYLPIFLSFNNFVFSKSLRAKGAAHSSKMKFFFVAVAAVAVILSSAYALTLPLFGHLLQVFGLAPDNSPSFVQRKTHSLNRRHVAVPTKLGNVTQSQYIAAKNPNHKVGTYAPILSPSFAILGSGAGVGTCCFRLKADVCAHRCFAMLKTTAQRETE